MICALKPQSTTSRASLRYIAHFSEVMDSQGCRRDPDPTLKTFCSNVPLKACRPIFRPVKQFGTIRTTDGAPVQLVIYLHSINAALSASSSLLRGVCKSIIPCPGNMISVSTFANLRRDSV